MAGGAAVPVCTCGPWAASPSQGPRGPRRPTGRAACTARVKGSPSVSLAWRPQGPQQQRGLGYPNRPPVAPQEKRGERVRGGLKLPHAASGGDERPPQHDQREQSVPSAAWSRPSDGTDRVPPTPAEERAPAAGSRAEEAERASAEWQWEAEILGQPRPSLEADQPAPSTGEEGQGGKDSEDGESSGLRGYLERVLDEAEDSEAEKQSQSPATRALREIVISLRTSPWFAVWLIIGIAGVLLYFSEIESTAPAKQVSPLLMGLSVLGVGTTKIVAGKTAVGTLGSALGATWRTSGGAGIIGFYLRAVLAGKRLRVVEYANDTSLPRRASQRVTSITIRSASARSLRLRLAKEYGLDPSEITLYQWMTPGVFERISDIGDLTLVPELGFIVWARPGVKVPIQGTLLSPEKPKSDEEVNNSCTPAALLKEIVDLGLDQDTESALVTLAINNDERLLALHSAFGRNADPRRFAVYAVKLVSIKDEVDRGG